MKSPSEKRKIAIAIVFASLMIISGVGIMAFQALSQWEPTSPHYAQPDSSATAGSTVDVYYGISVSFPSGSVPSGSNSATNSAVKTTYSYTSYPAPSYPPYPAYPNPAGDGWNLKIGSTQVASGSVGSIGSYSHSQSFTHTTAVIDGRTVYYTHAYSYSSDKKSWGGT